MSHTAPSLPSGTRDFLPHETLNRQYLFGVIRQVFAKFGYQPIETPAMEKLSVLTGKYGEEGDQLIFKILNNGDYLSKVDEALLARRDSKALIPQLAERALRYDLTVPFARYVVMHQNELAFPFKRYQIQPVWRADRPQKGRYREFYQCDVDVVGSNSLLHEAEFIAIYDEVLSTLGLRDFSIRLNHRALLQSLTELAGVPDQFADVCVAIDKLDKIGPDGVARELSERGLRPEAAQQILSLIGLKGSPQAMLDELGPLVAATPSGSRGIAELREVLRLAEYMGIRQAKVEIDLTLARGLSYYTGTIFEVVSHEVQMGSLGGGGRYDNLTGMFGRNGLSGAGISLGAERIYDVLEALGLFGQLPHQGTQVLILHTAEAEADECRMLSQLRSCGIASERYPEPAKLGKQFGYADKKRIPWCVLYGAEERQEGLLSLKNMQTGEQQRLTPHALLAILGHDGATSPNP
ncbi:MAG: histidine--tRNA ligase [Bacteroidetes bacterium]|jgi:histidyl-tRNA synthetase|nr:histidine--tRNA ligase [Bacteroidota bacterium]